MLAQDAGERERLQYIAFDERHIREIDDRGDGVRLHHPIHQHRPLAGLHENACDMRSDQPRADDARVHSFIVRPQNQGQTTISTRSPLEKPVLPLPAPARLLADFGPIYAANAVVAFLFAATGPVAIILAVGARGVLSESDIASWIFGAFFANGLISVAFSLLYRQPLIFLWSIPGAVLVGWGT